MSVTIPPTTQRFEGVVTTGPNFHSLRIHASLTLIEHADEFECRFVFNIGSLIELTVHAPKTADKILHGTARDPRGWDVSFVVELNEDRVFGTYAHSHDAGTFTLREV